MQSRSSFAEISVWHDSKRQATGSELLHRPAGVNDERRIVSGIEKTQRTCFRIEFGIKEGDEPVGRDAFDKVTIDCTNRLRQRVLTICLRVNRCVQRRHEQCGSCAFARNVSQGYHHFTVGPLDEIVVVTSDLVTWEADTLQFIASNMRCGGR